MKKPNVIVFDVDNTLVKGNLTFFFLKLLILERFYFFRKCFFLLLKGAFLVFRQLPHMTKTLFAQQGNVYRLDQSICHAMAQFYKELGKTLESLDLTGTKLQKKAELVFCDHFFKKYVYTKGIDKVKHHLRHQNNIVVLLSGSMQELLDIFFVNLCKQFDNEGIKWRNRFFAHGTKLEKDRTVTLCIGSQKNKILKNALSKMGHDDYTLQFIYSDNHFMADLPLLIEAKHGGALISEQSELYRVLPKKLLRSFIFLPEWKKRPI